MPIEFSRHAYKQLKDYFQDAVEWMVHNQLNPAFPRFDPVFKVAFDKLEAEVRGRTGSQLVSSVWNADFRRALLARPHIEVTTYPIDLCHPCDACNRSGHPASFDMKLYGKAYSLDTLEPLADAESDEEQSDNEDDEQERDRDGYILPDEDTRFYLGRFVSLTFLVETNHFDHFQTLQEERSPGTYINPLALSPQRMGCRAPPYSWLLFRRKNS